MLVYRSVVLLINISEFWAFRVFLGRVQLGCLSLGKIATPPCVLVVNETFKSTFPVGWRITCWTHGPSYPPFGMGRGKIIESNTSLGSGYVSSKESTEFYGMEPSLSWLNVLSGFRPPTETVR